MAAAAKVEPATVTVWVMETAAVLTMDTANTAKNNNTCNAYSSNINIINTHGMLVHCFVALITATLNACLLQAILYLCCAGGVYHECTHQSDAS